MNAAIRKWWQDARQVRMFSPRGFFQRAIVLMVLYAMCHMAGLREFTTIISGTSPSGGRADMVTGALGAAYIAIYLTIVCIVPVLVLGAGIFWVLEFITAKGRGGG